MKLFLVCLFFLLFSCVRRDGESGFFLCPYIVSKDQSKVRYYFSAFSGIALPSRAEVEYIPLKFAFSEPYVEIEGASSVIKRIHCEIYKNGILAVLRKKCELNTKDEWVKVRIYGHNLDVITLGSKTHLYSSDTIRSSSGKLELVATYCPGSSCNIICDIPYILITGEENPGTLKISGQSDTVRVDLYENGALTSIDFRGLNYAFLRFNSTQCDEENPVDYAISYAGSPEQIYFVMDHCRELRYRGTPVLNGASGSRVYPEF